MLGKTHSEDSIAKMRVSAKNVKRKTRTEEHKINQFLAVSGANSNTARKINIYNANGDIMFTCNGNMATVCNDNNLPKRALMSSLHNNGKPIFTNTTKTGQPTKKATTWANFVGWYATYSD